MIAKRNWASFFTSIEYYNQQVPVHRYISRQTPCLRKIIINQLEIIVRYINFLPYQKFSNGLRLTNLYDHLTFNGLLYENQYGFRKYHSTELAAVEFTNRIRQEMYVKKIPFSAFLDLCKAFDTLDHTILLTKLHYHGIRDASNWFKSYLSKRTQYIECNGSSSSIRDIETGVPQGFILGPLLFMIYMNDINSVSDNLNFILYADDTTLRCPLRSFTR